MRIPSMSDIKILFNSTSELVKKGMTLEAQEKIIELREIVLEIRESNLELQEENSELKKLLSDKESLVFEGNVYWRNLGSGEREGPFCPSCKDDKGKHVHLMDNGDAYYCAVCHYTWSYKQSESVMIVPLRGPFEGF